MLVLFVRAVTLPGAFQGISYLFTPQFNQLLNPKVSARILNIEIGEVNLI